jgi:hypothetical protein
VGTFPSIPLLFLWRCAASGTAAAFITSASLLQKDSALAATVLAFAFVEEILFSCFFERLSALRVAAAAFLSLASFCFASFAAFHSAAILVLVGAGKMIGEWARGGMNDRTIEVLVAVAAVSKG